MPLQKHALIFLLLPSLMHGCLSDFDPDERFYGCNEDKQCIEADFVCITTEVDGVKKPDHTLTPWMGVCLRKCDDEESLCPEEFNCQPDLQTTGPQPTSACVPSGSVIPTPPDGGITSIEFDQGPLEDGGSTEQPDTGIVVGPDFGVDCGAVDCGLPPPDCVEACNNHCSAIEDCQVPCNRAQCVARCDSGEVPPLLEGSFCPALPGTLSELPEGYENYGADCEYFCDLIDDYITGSEVGQLGGEDGVCGEVLSLSNERKAACVMACQGGDSSNPTKIAEFALRTGQLIYAPETPTQCPLDDLLESHRESPSRPPITLSVKDLFVPCDLICDEIFSVSESTPCQNVECPAMDSRETCKDVCAYDPARFFVRQQSEICGSLGRESPILSRTELCGIQCSSNNGSWGQTAVGTLTTYPFDAVGSLNFQLGNTIDNESLVKNEFRICFRQSGLNPGAICDKVISGRLGGSLERAEFYLDFTTFSNGDKPEYKFALSFSVPESNTEQAAEIGELILGYTASHSENSNYYDLLAETPRNNVISSETSAQPLLRGDRGYVSKLISDGNHRIRFQFSSLRLPSDFIIEHFAVKSVETTDAHCQDQCFDESSEAYCNKICDADSGLMATCAKNPNIPMASGVPFTSGGLIDRPFCASPDLVENQRFSDLAQLFDAQSCKRECLRNRCDLQFQVNALYNSAHDEPEKACRLLNFGGSEGFAADQNDNDLSRFQLCCLCGQDYCDAIGAALEYGISCGGDANLGFSNSN